MEEKKQLSKIKNVEITKEIKTSFINYSMSVIVARALPDVRDGLKPVHRRILYTMFEKGLTPDKAYHKCADTVGSVLGSYHPHGDVSVYDALVRLAQDFSMRYMLVDGHGNFGSVDGDPPAAYRYTESRMSNLSFEMLVDINKNTVDYRSNYDDRLQEPTVLPSHFPNLLVNGSTGIAVGMATNIPPHNMGEVIDGMCYMIDHSNAEMADLMEYIKGPDFPTGGIIMGRSGICAAYATGRGKIVVRARAEIEEAKNGHFQIIISELPYQVNKARLIENIADMVKEKRLEGIANIQDHSDRNGMRVVIDIKKEASPKIVLNQLYRYTQMQSTFGVIMIAIVNGEPKLLNLKEVLTEYIKFQKEVVTRRTQFDLNKVKDRMHILKGLTIALSHIDAVIEILRDSKTISEAKEKLAHTFELDEIQIQASAQMPLMRLVGMERQKILDEIVELTKKMHYYEEILSNKELLHKIIKDETIAIRNKFADKRRTEIETVSGEVDIEDLIPRENYMITLTNFGYVKRQKIDPYHTQRRGGRGVSAMTRREGDMAAAMFVINSHDYVLYFSNLGRVYRLKCYEIPECSRTSKGMNIANLLPIGPEEHITSMIHVPVFEEGKYLVMVTRKGIIKKTNLNAYHTTRKGGLIAVDLDEGDKLAWVSMTDGKKELIVSTKKGMAICFNETDVRAMGRAARGVKVLRLNEGDYVVGLTVLRKNCLILTVSETGYGRLSSPLDYRIQFRGGKGLINYHVKKYGDIASVKAVDPEEDIIMIAANGAIIRIHISSIRECRRPSKGVRVMRIDEGNRVITLARAPHKEEPISTNENQDRSKRI